MLAQLINRSFGTTTVYGVSQQLTSSGRAKAVGEFEFIGARDATRIAAYAYDVLLRQLRRDRSAFMRTLNKRLKRATKIRRGDAFAEAWVAGAKQNVAPLATNADEAHALHQRYLEKHYGHLDTLTVRDHKPLRRHDRQAVVAGYNAGWDAHLSAGVETSYRGMIGLETASNE